MKRAIGASGLTCIRRNLLRFTPERFGYDEIAGLETEQREASDDPDFGLALKLRDGRKVALPFQYSRPQRDKLKALIEAWLKP